MSNVRTAAVEVAEKRPAQVTTKTVVEGAIADLGDALAAVLPSTVSPERFERLVLSALKGTPKLVECFETRTGKASLLVAVMACAAVGLEPNSPTKDAWILPRNVGNGRDRHVEAELQIGYRGYQILAENTGEVTVYADVVHEADSFEWWRDVDGDHLEHRPNLTAERGEYVAAYAIARYHDGRPAKVTVLTREDIHKRRDESDSWRSDRKNGTRYSPWSKWPDEQARKTAVRTLCKQQLRMSAEQAQVVEAEGARLSLGDGVIEARHEDERPARAAAPPVADESTSAEVPTTDEPVEAPATPDESPVVGPPASAEAVPDDEVVDVGIVCDVCGWTDHGHGNLSNVNPNAGEPCADCLPPVSAEPEAPKAVRGPPPPIAPDRPVSGDEGPTAPEMTAEQWRAVQRLLRLHRQAAGPTTFSTLTEILGRPVANRNDLDGDDAARVIDLLQAEADAKAADADPPPDAA